MERELGSITGYIDVAQVTLYFFWLFFAGLIWHLTQEGRREGYPKEDDAGVVEQNQWLWVPTPKTFKRGASPDISVPNDKREVMPPVEPMTKMPGTAYRPTGPGLGENVGPGSWTEREDVPDMDAHGKPRIVPIAKAEAAVAEGDANPVGLEVVGYDRKVAGTISDIWVDHAEALVRYYEVSIGSGDTARKVLIPSTFAKLQSLGPRKKRFFVNAITAAQFAGVPATKKNDSITKLEEEKISAYYGGGLFYANETRAESFL